MVNPKCTFVIDATFLFDASHKVFFGTPLLVVDGEDHTFLFGVVRDFLRLRRSLGIRRAAVVIGDDACRVTTPANIEKVTAFLKALRIPVVHEPETRVLDLCSMLSPIAAYFVTRNRHLLRFAGGKRVIILIGDKGEPEALDAAAIASRCGIGPDRIPAFLALTEGPAGTTLTRRQATALLQRYGDLPNLLENSSVVSARQTRARLRENKAILLERFRQLRPIRNASDITLDVDDRELDLDTDRAAELLKAHSFHSLVRLLPVPKGVQIRVCSSVKPARSYHAVTTADGISSLVSRLASAEVCALDTESSGKDAHNAELFGVSFSVKSGEAFYLPVVPDDLQGVGPEAALRALKNIVGGHTNFVGHNTKYDWVLLRRHGIEICHVHFDTMLAAHECFGDWDLLNLPHLAKRLLGKEITPYKDVVPKGQTFLDVPFTEMVNHACQDADTTIQLYRVLQEETVRRGILEQYRNETLRLAATLVNWEIEGIPVRTDRLSRLRRTVLNAVDAAQAAIVDFAGVVFDVNAEKEIRSILRRDAKIADLMGSRKATLSVLEDLAISHHLPRLVVKHRRAQRLLRRIEAILSAVEKGRLHPVFSQTKNAYDQLAAVNPSLFEDWGNVAVGSCFTHPVKVHFRSAGGSLDTVERLSGDVILRQDRRAARIPSRFLKVETLLDDVDDQDLLLCIMTGSSNEKLCHRFLCDRSSIAAIRHELATRYVALFRWLRSYRRETLDRGFAANGGRRRWLDGLGSSNVEKRERAANTAVRWLLRY